MTELDWMQEYAAAEIDRAAGNRRAQPARHARAAGGDLRLGGRGDGVPGRMRQRLGEVDFADDDSHTGRRAALPRRPVAAKPPVTGGPPGHVLSVAATDPDVKAANVTFPGPASTMLGYLARPAAPGRYPAVLVNHEIFGLTDHIRDVARRLAKVGYIALAVDLVSRAGGSDKPGVDIVGALFQGSIDDRVDDLNAGVTFLESQPDYNGKLGVIGFCFGGGMTLSFAAANDEVLAAGELLRADTRARLRHARHEGRDPRPVRRRRCARQRGHPRPRSGARAARRSRRRSTTAPATRSTTTRAARTTKRQPCRPGRRRPTGSPRTSPERANTRGSSFTRR